jgi:hypothetical protein
MYGCTRGGDYKQIDPHHYGIVIKRDSKAMSSEKVYSQGETAPVGPDEELILISADFQVIDLDTTVKTQDSLQVGLTSEIVYSYDHLSLLYMYKENGKILDKAFFRIGLEQVVKELVIKTESSSNFQTFERNLRDKTSTFLKDNYVDLKELNKLEVKDLKTGKPILTF